MGDASDDYVDGWKKTTGVTDTETPAEKAAREKRKAEWEAQRQKASEVLLEKQKASKVLGK